MVYEDIADPFRRLVRIMERLQEPGGCPWDLEQTHESLKPYLIEEAYEALDAIDSGDDTQLAEELRVGTRFRRSAPVFPVLHKSLVFAIIFI